MPRRHTFPLAERLKSRKQIDSLFRSGKSFAVYPLRVFYRWEGVTPTRVGVGAPKRHFKRAVDRNRIKRLLREGYRLQKESLSGVAPGLHVFIIYTGKELPTQAGIMEKIGVILNKLKDLQP
jgi:ribonuclease P protein component